MGNIYRSFDSPLNHIKNIIIQGGINPNDITGANGYDDTIATKKVESLLNMVLILTNSIFYMLEILSGEKD